VQYVSLRSASFFPQLIGISVVLVSFWLGTSLLGDATPVPATLGSR
jgi:hypothetical protein